MPKVSVTGFVAKMAAAKLAKKRRSLVKTKKAKPARTRLPSRPTGKFCVYQEHDGESKLVCECKTRAMAVELARGLNHCAKGGVRFVVD